MPPSDEWYNVQEEEGKGKEKGANLASTRCQKIYFLLRLCHFHSKHEVSRPKKVNISRAVSSVTRKNRQMSIKVAQNDFSRKMIHFDSFKKLPKNVVDLGKLIFVKGFKKLPKVK